jgi:hypothetical protein
LFFGMEYLHHYVGMISLLGWRERRG